MANGGHPKPKPKPAKPKPAKPTKPSAATGKR